MLLLTAVQSFSSLLPTTTRTCFFLSKNDHHSRPRPLPPAWMVILSATTSGSSSISSVNVIQSASVVVGDAITNSPKELYFAQETSTTKIRPANRMAMTKLTTDGPDPATKPDYDDIIGPLGRWLDTLLLTIFRNKLAEQVMGDLTDSTGSSSSTPLAAVLAEPANYTQIVQLAAAMNARFSDPVTVQTCAQTVLRNMFPSWLPPQYAALFSRPFPAFAARMNARATATAGVWLMGECHVNDVPLTTAWGRGQGVLVTRCRFLEESGCASVCVNSCQIPTQNFFKQNMGLPLTMEPDYATGSCQFTFGRTPDLATTKAATSIPCLTRCPTAGSYRKQHSSASARSGKQQPDQPLLIEASNCPMMAGGSNNDDDKVPHGH